MKAYELIDELCSFSEKFDKSSTVDTYNIGSSEVEISKVAVTMFATPYVVTAAHEWGAELVITHEPLWYNHAGHKSDEKLECEKRSFIEKTGMTVFRFHDHPHYTKPDIIAEGELKAMGLTGRVEYTDEFDLVRLTLDEPMTALELAKHIEKTLGIRRVAICGERDKKSTKISCMFGAPGTQIYEIAKDECEILLTGEAWEWRLGEYARDASQLGYNKSVIFMGHIGSEREGMKYTAEIIKEKHPELDVKYFECGEVCTYTDD